MSSMAPSMVLACCVSAFAAFFLSNRGSACEFVDVVTCVSFSQKLQFQTPNIICETKILENFQYARATQQIANRTDCLESWCHACRPMHATCCALDGVRPFLSCSIRFISFDFV